MRALIAAIAALALLVVTIAAATRHGSSALVGWLAALTSLNVALAALLAVRVRKPPIGTHERDDDDGRAQALAVNQTVSRIGFGRFWGAAIGAVAAVAILPFVAFARRSARREPAWTAGSRLVTTQGEPIRADSLLVGSVETVFPANHVGASESATLLLRLPENVLRGPSDRSDWSPKGNVAYSKICTHAGCPVAIYRRASYQLYCPCHQSLFDVLDAAKPQAGPATRALPQLALGIDAEGYLIARGAFSGPVGPDEWNRPI